ncbi:acyl-CoA dehydrogenase family protein [Pseudomonas sp. GD03860]|uniref:acyl-CoA dehydrogenase n=1 Tax=Pseudomonas TaxID=286 RepID=UPI002363F8DD|nr:MULTISPECIES: acyl-CoA dehydrogenase [Pseudomonas]MDD2058365.1 acyl-CoA dehydrogenase family protein [Pseudomonas putida]MDH0636295.1 acyl-CoA dehydrogenase family protein [Pseudomonas sp. GD03860]
MNATTLPSNEERQMLKDSLEGYLSSHWDYLKPDLAGIWQGLAELGLTALGSDPAYGGLREWLIVMEGMGKHACPAPLHGSFLANRLLVDAPALPLIDSLAKGGCAVGVALTEEGARLAERDSKLDGHLAIVDDLDQLQQLLVIDPALGVRLIDLNATGISRTTLPGLAVPALHRLDFCATPVQVLESNTHDLDRLARLGYCARALGAANRAFEMVVEYVKERQQFGQPIGRFQALQHKLADCITRLDGVRLTLANAAQSHDLGNPDWRFYASAAIAYASTALRQVSLEVHHSFGAIGYSEEHEAPRHFRRVHADLSRLGGARRARQELAAFLVDDGQRLPEYDLGQAGNAFRQEVRDWLKANWTDLHQSAYQQLPFAERKSVPKFTRALGKQGWLALGWPERFGGQARTPLEQLAFIEEVQQAGIPKPGGEIQGHALMQFGTPEQQAFFLPKIRAGEIRFCLGYSEPSAGSDLAAIRTTAVSDGDEWVINGQKLWTTFAEDADYLWLAARTDPTAKAHAGISLFIVPMNTPGITVHPSMALYGHTFCTEFLDNVRVPATALVGEVNQGWTIITSALATERVQMGGFVAHIRANYERLVAELRLRGADPVARDTLGQLAAEIEVARQLLGRSIGMLEQGQTPVYEAAMSKAFTAELMERLGEAALDLLGVSGTLGELAPDAPCGGKLEQVLRQSIMMVIGGGTNEIQRTLIAQRGLGLPR